MVWTVTVADPTVIALALSLDLLLGDPAWLPHPVVAIGRLITFLDAFLRRRWLNERLAGLLLLALVASVAGGTVWGVLYLSNERSPLVGWLFAIVISATCLATRSLHRESARVADALVAGNLPEARRYLSYIVGRDTGHLGEDEIWRGVIETVAENSCDGIMAPLFWLTIGGPVGAMVYKAVSTLDSMVGYRNPRYLQIGWASARMDDLLNYIPARVTALLLIVAAPCVGCSPAAALRITLRDRHNHPSPNSGHPEAAAAGALGVRLGGEASYGGVVSWKQYIGDPLQPHDERAYRTLIRLMYISTLLMAAICLTIASCLKGIHVPSL